MGHPPVAPTVVDTLSHRMYPELDSATLEHRFFQIWAPRASRNPKTPSKIFYV